MQRLVDQMSLSRYRSHVDPGENGASFMFKREKSAEGPFRIHNMYESHPAWSLLK